ncbi:MAG: TonB-dependent receptor plug domain-containing protein, partial [Gammaproteobacteria bacterium]
MKNRNPVSQAVRLALMTGVATTMSAPVWSADADAEGDARQLSKIEVTGSRIKRTDIETSQPLLILQREDIERTGLVSVGDILQSLPIAGSALNTTFNNGGTGATQIDLRNLGAKRVLVLVNGRRWVDQAGSGGLNGVDLNTIPVSIIERIEILKDGASAIYGSDAIAGVVNIITRRDFEGLGAGIQIGEYDDSDGRIEFYDFSVGTSSAKTSVYMNVSYRKQDEIFAGDRAISSEPNFGIGAAVTGSSGTPRGRWIFIDPNTGTQSITLRPSVADLQSPNLFNAGGPMLPAGPFGSNGPPTYTGGVGADFIAWDNQQRFNFAPDNYMVTPMEVTNIYAQAAHDITDNLTFTAEVLYNNRKSEQKLAPEPLFLGSVTDTITTIHVTNPFNPFGFTLDPNTNWALLGRRMFEAGNRDSRQDVDTFRFGGGFDGTFEAANRFWDWNASYTYSKNESNDTNVGSFQLANIRTALGPLATCTATPGCVPLNVFSGSNGNPNVLAGTPGTITQGMLDFISYTANEVQNNEMVNYVGNISTDLVELPAGPLGIAVGYEYREQKGFDQPDALVSAGLSTTSIRQPTRGSYSVTEYYAEVNVPILADLPGADRLSLS